MSRTRIIVRSTTSVSLAVICHMIGFGQSRASAEEGHCCIDWSKLNLSSSQSQQIHNLETQWNHDYNELKPAIIDDQSRLQRLLADHNSDPVEIMALQQTIARKKEQLNGIATANYLKKRQVLNDNQQASLELMVRQAVVQRQHSANPGSQTEVMPDRVQDLIQRVRNIWPVQQER